ncbi:MAG: UDP-N-acetylmuramoyl-tripeptide--D-alanyl-D-alanine ligase [Candidatus Amulumruptor caecigallinarius]|nr:UDP-N-acetylmuramoyl-tripeptide--D-alanyl-D-alanine ligase [Candidatus Amulumruptor caecigallinarius]MCM1397820.1 UDP-N-acetylmuramoyl-tripeptide--D-alanyl-D-alanine ligase [Candidatus Amulumruptor caecigallinarius]MCM1453993.1 UDP-N-acetylmuramoyl-tripeptide--D-alanyl-D-alanine ligase [bacterium]
MTTYIIIYAIALAATIPALAAELSRCLMMLQQNSYRNERYMRWLRTSADSTSVPHLMGIFTFLAMLASMVPQAVGMLVAFLFCAIMAVRLISAKYKKPLVWTPRARRIYITALSLVAVIGAAIVIPLSIGTSPLNTLHVTACVMVGAYVVSHCIIMAANWLLKPVESRINGRFVEDARRILRSMPELKVVGITGSYGKTSTKHFLTRILAEKYDTLMTPGSYNTTLGVVRTIRELMKPYTEVFVCEMGAKQPGDIAEICDLVHPSVGIVTAVGEQHLESFGSIDNVQRTKFELVDALPADGLAVVNNDFEKCAERPVSNTECIRYGITAPHGARFTAKDIRYSPRGTEFTVVDTQTGLELPLSTALVGECNISDLLAAVIVALRLGVEPQKIAYAVSHIEPVEHRLQVKHTPGGITIIDDAYNSNPAGSRMAMEVLRQMTGGRRIVITPGMIELGDKQEELNERLGVHIATAADVAIIVGRYNRDALTRGIASVEGGTCRVETVDSFADAQRLLSTIAAPGDTVLYENDLPDTFK